MQKSQLTSGKCGLKSSVVGCCCGQGPVMYCSRNSNYPRTQSSTRKKETNTKQLSSISLRQGTTVETQHQRLSWLLCTTTLRISSSCAAAVPLVMMSALGVRNTCSKPSSRCRLRRAETTSFDTSMQQSSRQTWPTGSNSNEICTTGTNLTASYTVSIKKLTDCNDPQNHGMRFIVHRVLIKL